MLYPNPSVGKIVENFHKHYYFIGRILGKVWFQVLFFYNKINISFR